MTVPVAVMVSGRGSNLDALAAASGDHYQIKLVLADRPCPAVQRAADRGIDTLVLPWLGHEQREQWSLEAAEAIRGRGIAVVACAGFMRILSPVFLQKVDVPVLNIHPSLLPCFRGLHPQQQALDAGVRISGATVHYVIAELDAGPIIDQRAVPVYPGDDVDSLATRILQEEHTLYPQALTAVASGRCTLQDGQVVWLDGS